MMRVLSRVIRTLSFSTVFVMPLLAVLPFGSCSKAGSWDVIRNIQQHGGFGRELVFEIDAAGTTWNHPGDSSDLEGFPFLIQLDTSTVDFLQNFQRQEVRFFDSAGRLLPHEEVEWNKGGVSTWWVRLSGFDKSSSANRIYLRYDYWINRPPAARPESEVWSNGFVGVWHLDEADGADSFEDSTGYGNNAYSGSFVPPPAAASVIGPGYGRSFNRPVEDYRLLSGPLSDEGGAGQLEEYTFSFWIDYSTVDFTYFMNKGDIQNMFRGSGEFNGYIFTDGPGPGAHQLLALSAGSWFHGGSNKAELEDHGWTHFQISSAGIAGLPPLTGGRLCSEGVSKSGTIHNRKGTGSRNGNLGSSIMLFRANGNAVFTIDEMRLSRVVRSADWARLEHRNITGAVTADCVEERALK